MLMDLFWFHSFFASVKMRKFLNRRIVMENLHLKEYDKKNEQEGCK